MKVSCPAVRGSGALVSLHIRRVSKRPADERNPFALQLSAIVKLHIGRVFLVDVNGFDPAAKFQLSAQRAKSFNQILQDQPHAFVRASKTFEENAAEHDAELAPGHVVFRRVSVPHQRAENHLDQQRAR